MPTHLVSCVRRKTSEAAPMQEPKTTMGRSGWSCDPRATTNGATVVPIWNAEEDEDPVLCIAQC